MVQEAQPGKEDRWSGLRRAEATVRPEEAKVKEVKKEVKEAVKEVQPEEKSEGKPEKKAEQNVLQLNVVLDDEKTTRCESFLILHPH